MNHVFRRAAPRSWIAVAVVIAAAAASAERIDDRFHTYRRSPPRAEGANRTISVSARVHPAAAAASSTAAMADHLVDGPPSAKRQKLDPFQGPSDSSGECSAPRHAARRIVYNTCFVARCRRRVGMFPNKSPAGINNSLLFHSFCKYVQPHACFYSATECDPLGPHLVS